MMAIGRVLFTAGSIARRVGELAAEIRRDYAGRPLTIVGVLQGAVTFVADLREGLGPQVAVEFVEASSYGDGTEPQGPVALGQAGGLDLAGRDVLLVDDIVDTGRTLAAVRSEVEAMGPRSVRTCVLLDKPSRRQIAVPLDYCGFVVGNVFVVGYGLDHAGRYRDLPHIARLELAGR
ncbi:MAG: hypoxanthine phosphoribosyltransferase [Planctomycetes bacterium]|nr:hypoxanthine phosphoribosyltransferase [Planctomycetota bacterium]